MKVASFFSGIGGIDLGLERAGMEVVFQCEVNKFCQTVLKKHWSDIIMVGDINAVKSREIPKADLWCGGFPCQDLSLANQGKRKGLEGERSGLFYKFAELAEKEKPRWLFMENVPGLLNSGDGEDFASLLKTLDELGEVGAFCNKSCGIHIHINAAPFEAYQLRNLVNIIASKEDMVYRALQVDSERESRFCRKIDTDFLERLNRKKPNTRSELQKLWYNGRDGSHQHYHDSRYHCLNLHSVFQKGTIEFRAFNGSIHAGKLKAYIQFCMAITAQAYNQRSASPIKTVSENEKYTFRVWLLRLDLIGDDFKTARKHLLDHLDGNIAWKSPGQAEAQKERIRKKREQELQQGNGAETVQREQQSQEEEQNIDIHERKQEENSPAFSMSMGI